jgi:hypothetical protein
MNRRDAALRIADPKRASPVCEVSPAERLGRELNGATRRNASVHDLRDLDGREPSRREIPATSARRDPHGARRRHPTRQPICVEVDQNAIWQYRPVDVDLGLSLDGRRRGWGQRRTSPSTSTLRVNVKVDVDDEERPSRPSPIPLHF